MKITNICPPPHLYFVLLFFFLTLQDKALSQQMYWTVFDSSTQENQSIRTARTNGDLLEILVNVQEAPLVNPIGIALDPGSRKIFWTDISTNQIHCSDYTGTNTAALPIQGLQAPDGIAVDETMRKIYWSERLANRISRADLDGSNVETGIIQFTADITPTQITIDQISRVLYISLSHSSGDFVNGWDMTTGQTVLGTAGFVGLRGLDVHSEAGRIYMSDSGAGKILSMNVDGSDLQTLYTFTEENDGAHSPFGVAVDTSESKLLWTSSRVGPNRSRIYRSNLDGTNVEVVRDDFSILSRYNGIVVDSQLACLTGSVRTELGELADVLFVNHEKDRVVVAAGDRIHASILPPPSGGPGKFVVHANNGIPDPISQTPLPSNVGDFCFPFFLTAGADPAAIWNNLGKSSVVGDSTYFNGNAIPDPPLAPSYFMFLPEGDILNLPPGTTVTFQAVLLDPGASPKPASVSNAVVLEVQ